MLVRSAPCFCMFPALETAKEIAILRELRVAERTAERDPLQGVVIEKL